MLFRVRRHIDMAQFRWHARGIRGAIPIACKADNPLVIFAALSHGDVPLYLVAIKSLHSRLGQGAVTVLDDGSLTDGDRMQIQRLVPAVEFREMKAVDTGNLPRDICWGRVVTALELARDRYVVQIDADTVATGYVEEILSAFRANRAFLLPTKSGQALRTLSDAAAFAGGLGGTHVQVTAERTFGGLEIDGAARYVRASAGLNGFPRGLCNRRILDDFSAEMFKRLGDRWREWGTDQIGSNFLLANTGDATVLPYPKYCCYDTGVSWKRASFLHFVGYSRFRDGAYYAAARKAIGAMR